MWYNKCLDDLNTYIEFATTRDAYVWKDAKTVLNILQGTPVKDVTVTYQSEAPDIFITAEFNCGMKICYTISRGTISFERIN
jgi:hypothetical protein